MIYVLILFMALFNVITWYISRWNKRSKPLNFIMQVIHYTLFIIYFPWSVKTTKLYGLHGFTKILKYRIACFFKKTKCLVLQSEVNDLDMNFSSGNKCCRARYKSCNCWNIILIKVKRCLKFRNRFQWSFAKLL